MTEATYLSPADTAKMVRAALKSNFPGQKFTVRTSVYSMGASINVNWVGDVAEAAVRAVAGVFAGSDFDGMTDSMTTRRQDFFGRPVRFGADFIFFRREA